MNCADDGYGVAQRATARSDIDDLISSAQMGNASYGMDRLALPSGLLAKEEVSASREASHHRARHRVIVLYR